MYDRGYLIWTSYTLIAFLGATIFMSTLPFNPLNMIGVYVMIIGMWAIVIARIYDI